ncbi:MAG: glycosyltransferase family 4 protein, partial [Candidatus Hodarchaeota archaeon]
DTLFFQDASIEDDLTTNTEILEKKSHDIMIFSRLNPGKMFEESLDIFKQVLKSIPEARFLIAGAIRSEDEAYLTELKEIAKRYGLHEKITFKPNPSLKDLRNLYLDSKILVFLPKNEPLGLVAVEAISAGVPVVGFNAGGITETVIDGKTGKLCEDNEAMINTLVDLLDAPEKIAKLRRNSMQTADKFSESRFLVELLGIIG